MRMAPGKSAYPIWFKEEDQDGNYADNPSKETMKKCETFLKSLARHMAELQKLKFDKLGMLSHEDYFEEPEIDGYWQEQQGALKRYKALSSTREVLMSGLEEKWPKEMSLQDMSPYDESNPETSNKQRKNLPASEVCVVSPS
jgi:hypothetical protein